MRKKNNSCIKNEQKVQAFVENLQTETVMNNS